MKKKAIVFAALISAVLFAGGMSSAEASTQKETVAIKEGVFIGAIDAGGMTEAKARETVKEYVESMKSGSFTLYSESGNITLTAEEMGVEADIDACVQEAAAVGNTGSLINRYKDEQQLASGKLTVNMHLSVDKQKTAQLIYDNKDKLDVAAVDNSLKKSGSTFEFVEGQSGSEVNIVDSVYQINDFLQNSWDGVTNEIQLVYETVEPRGSREELAMIKDKLGSFSTDFSTSAAGRSANVKNACNLINGKVIYPGEEFSVYKAISPITVENGYEIAGAYSNGQVVDSVGGGVCQVATTLYNAVIRAELEIVQRYNHSMIVGYASPSSDAAIAGTYKDLKFKNNYEQPVFIEGYCSGGIITFNIYGVETRPANRTVSFRSETLSEEMPNVQFNFDASQPVGYYNVEQSAHKAVVARLWKTVTVDGNVESDEVFNNSKYNSSPKIVTVGTNGASAELLAQMNAAAAANDEATVKSLGQSAATGQTDTATPNDSQSPTDSTTAPIESTAPADTSQTETVTPTEPESPAESVGPTESAQAQ